MNLTLIFCLAIAAGLYMAWTIGANDVANAMGTSVGAKSITFKQAIVLAAIFDFLGAMLVGSHVTTTIHEKIVNPEIVADPQVFIAGMLAALIAAAIWVHVASHYGLPVSTSHSIVGAVFAFGLVQAIGQHNLSAVKWGTMFSIVMSWIISPVAGALIGFLIFSYIQRGIFKSDSPALAARKIAPQMIFLVIAIIFLSIIYKGPKSLRLDMPLLRAIPIAAVLALAGTAVYIFALRNKWGKLTGLSNHEQLEQVENIFRYIQVATACFVAFAHGANDVANAVGPIAGIYARLSYPKEPDPFWMMMILALGAGGIILGLATFGYNVMATIGEKITELCPTRGFSAEFACATTVLTCSQLGLPVSTTHTIVGAVIGVGLARGIAAVDRKVVINIFYSWIITIPIAALIAVIIYPIIRLII